MKKQFLILCILFSIAVFAHPKTRQKVKKAGVSAQNEGIPMPPKPGTRYTCNVDDRIKKGPNIEKVFIGHNEGSYYF